MMKRDVLAEKVISVFKSSKFVTDVSVYGSLDNGKSDIYSDLDLVVKTDNPENTINKLPSILSQVDSYYVVLPIQETAKEAVYTVMWKNISFYQKLDLKIVFSKKISKPINFSFDENKRYFYDYMIGTTRMIKYCKRNMFWSAYKFYKASLEMLLKLKLESLDSKSRQNVSLQDFIELDKAKVGYCSYIHFDIKNNGILRMTRNFLELSLKMKKVAKSSNEYHFAKKVIKFTANELGAKSGNSTANSLSD